MDTSEDSLLAAPVDSTPLRDCFRELQERQEEWEGFLKDSFEELEKISACLSQREHEITQQQTELQRQREELAAADSLSQGEVISVDQHTRQIAELETELESVRAQLDDYQDASVGNSAANDVAAELEIEQLTDQLAASRKRGAQLESSLEALARAQGGASTAEGAVGGSAVNEGEGISAAGDPWNEQIETLLAERESLEKELEDVRSNANQVTESLEKTKRQMAEERAEWSVELKQMRQILQNQSDMFQSYSAGATVPASVVAASDETMSEAAGDKDRVVGSVMAQFEKIRQQRARRKGNQKSGQARKNDCA